MDPAAGTHHHLCSRTEGKRPAGLPPFAGPPSVTHQCDELCAGPDAQEVQAEAEEVVGRREGRTFGESFVQRRGTLTASCPSADLLPAAPGEPCLASSCDLTHGAL